VNVADVREGFVCKAIHCSRDVYFIWVSDSDANVRDRVLLDADNQIPAFSSEGAAREFAAALVSTVSEGLAHAYDFDILSEWCETPGAIDLDVKAVLDAWNLFTDLEFKSTEATNLFDQVQGSANALYDKLFWANNVPSVTPDGETFTPEWEESELVRLSWVLRAGLREFVSRLRTPT
jgi:hypothetical protein